jgi:hypothetical protein
MIFWRNYLVSVASSLLIVSFPDLILGQIDSGSTEQSSKSATAEKKYFLSCMIEGGGGLENHKVGLTSTNESIEISAGGGIGFGLQAGYIPVRQLELEVEAAYLVSVLSQNLDNGEGGFNRSVIAGNLLYRVPVRKDIRVLIGGGAGYYMGGKMDLDFSGASDIGGAHNIYDYDNALGYQIRCMFELFGENAMFSRKIIAGIGLQYTSVRYELKSMTSNGVDIPLEMLPSEVKAEFGKLDGSGVEVLLYLAYYL